MGHLVSGKSGVGRDDTRRTRVEKPGKERTGTTDTPDFRLTRDPETSGTSGVGMTVKV